MRRPPSASRALLALGTLLAALAGIPSSAFAISYRTLFTPTGLGAEALSSSVASAGDMNGDGYADVIVGAPLNDTGASDGGRALVFFGGPGADDVPDLTLIGTSATELLGYSVASAGDFNGDGFDDVIVGAPFNDTGGANIGRAYIFFGGPNPDAIADITFTGVAPGDEFGYSVASAGDVNGDGYGDLIVGAPLNDAAGLDAGRAYVFYGGPATDNLIDITVTGATAGDGFGTAAASAGDFNGDGYGDFAAGAPYNDVIGVDAGAAYLYFGGPGEDASVDLTFNGAVAGDQFGFSLDNAGDVNGDGFGDLLVGAPLNDTAGANAGRAYVFYGGPLADNVADLTLSGAVAGDQFGNAVARAGDANADGFADLIVGAPFNDAGGTNAGRAYVFFGAAAPNTVADITITGVVGSDELGLAVAGAGDVNGDGFAEVVTGAPGNDIGGANAGRAYVTAVYAYQVLSPNGGETWVSGAPSRVHWLGHDPADLAISLDGGVTWSTLVAGAGGLEENEVTVTAPGPATALAKVRLSINAQTVKRSTSDMSDAVFRIVEPTRAPAAASRVQRSFIGAAGDNLGWAVAGAGDVNGDGFDDVIVGAPLNDTPGANAGRAFVFFGGPGADAVADLTLSGAAANDEFGYSVSGVGDVNHDGFSDVIVGAPFNDFAASNAGRAYVFFGGNSPDAVADLTLTGAAANDQLGYSVAGAGDVNRDGFDDVFVGAPFNDTGATNAGRAYLFFGGLAPDAISDLAVGGEAIADQFGASVAGAGDVNGDGFADLIAGSSTNDIHGSASGRAYVYFGGTVPNTTVDLFLDGQASGDGFGVAVAGAGDVNGDGFDDVIVGANFNETSGVDAGRAYLYFGGPAPDAIADFEVGGVTLDELGLDVAGAGDVNGDGYADLIVGARANSAGGSFAGRAYLLYGGPTPDAMADLAIAGLGANDNLGRALAGAGDVNGDGFDDVIVGSHLNDAGGADAGAAYLYDLNRYFVLSPNGGETWNVGATNSVSWLGAEPADLWLSVDGGASYQRIESGVGGAASNAVAIRVPHLPGRFARVKLTPSDAAVAGGDASDSLFTIQTSVSLLSFAVAAVPGGGALLQWSTDPGVGPQGLAGYRVYRLLRGGSGAGVRIGPDPVTENRYEDRGGAAGDGYRLAAVNRLGEELELGRAMLPPSSPLAAWPLPYRGGALTISFATASGLGGGSGEAEVVIYDVAGRMVATIARGGFAAGVQQVTWDGRDQHGQPVRNGLYVLRVTSGGVRHQLKALVLR
jgi:hypothetical protein